MPGPLLDIQFPIKGLSEYTGYTDQPPETTPHVKNWVLRDPSTGRNRGAKRAGTTRYVTAQVNGSNAVQCVTSLNRQNARVAYSAVNSGNGPNAAAVVWENDVPDDRLGDVRAMTLDRFGNVYVLCGRDGVIAKYGGDGELMWKHTVKLTADSGSVYQTLYCIQVDFDGDIFVGVGGTSGATNGVVYRFQQAENGLEHVFTWGGSDVAGLVADIAIEGQWMYVAENTGDDYKLHRVGGIKTRSPVQEWFYQAAVTGVNQPVTAIGILPDGSCVVSYRYDPGETGSGDNMPDTGRVQVIGQQGTLLATYGDTDTEGGCGWGMDIDDDGNIWTTGNQQGGTGGNEDDTLVKLAWNGSALSRTAGYDGSALAMPGNFQGPDSLCVDRDGRCYVGTEDGTDGKDLMRFTESAGTISLSWNVSIIEDVYCIRPDTFYPVAATDPNYGTLGPEHIFVGANDIGGQSALYKVRLLDAAITDLTPRTLEVLAVAGGTIKKRASSSTWNTPTGSVTLDTNLRFVTAATGFDKAYFADGETYIVYDPYGDSGNGSVALWKASKGRIPPRCKIMVPWQGRMLLARDADNPFNYYLSAHGDFDDWDFFPFPPTVTQAVAGNYAPAGLCPDIINCVIPYSDDLCIFGCDHTIYRMTGNPADDGRFDLISDITGIAFGSPWCKNPEGVLYFMGSRGGIFAYAPGGVPQEISNAFIRERLAVIDFADVRVQLTWNDRERSVMVFIMPTDTSAPENYIYDVDNGGWWPFDFATAAVTADVLPNCIHVIDGDEAGDRRILIGRHDGYVAYWNPSADADDDGVGDYAIDADLYMGPYVPEPDGEVRVTKLYGILGFSSADTTAEVYGSDSPDFNDKGSAKLSGTLTSNRTTTINGRARGHALWFRLRNATAGQKCQFESLRAEVFRGSRVRVRS